MQTFSYKDYPIKIFGLPLFEENGKLERLPDEVIEKVPTLEFFGKRCPGGRLCFRTNSPEFTVKAKFKTLGPDAGMSVFSCQSFDVLAGDRKMPRFLGLVTPYNLQTFSFEATFDKGAEMEDITIYLARNEKIEDITIEIEDGALIEEPTPYRYKPIVFYGSSITEGGCCSNVKNSYTSILSSRLDADFYCLGFSGSAKGELPMADFINTLDMSMFVFDYDHNAPDAEHLRIHQLFSLVLAYDKHRILGEIRIHLDADAGTVGNTDQRCAGQFYIVTGYTAADDGNVYRCIDTIAVSSDPHAIPSRRNIQRVVQRRIGFGQSQGLRG